MPSATDYLQPTQSANGYDSREFVPETSVFRKHVPVPVVLEILRGGVVVMLSEGWMPESSGGEVSITQ
jgi:hypothetical protein